MIYHNFTNMQLQIKVYTFGYQLQVANTLLRLIFRIQFIFIIITLKIKLKGQMIINKTRDQIIT